MPRLEARKPGSFCWIELATSDQEAAKAFYSNLFGWSADDTARGSAEIYTVFRLDGQLTGAAFELEPRALSSGISPMWLIYVAVADADATAHKAAHLGGTLLKEPFDVFEAGRMAVIADPTGTVFCIWQAIEHNGVHLICEEGTLCWADLSSPDPAKAKIFYEALFGWKIAPEVYDATGYLHIKNGSDIIGGVQSLKQRNLSNPPHWLIYIQTADCNGTVAKAEDRSAEIYVSPMSVPNNGRFAVLADPQGAIFALFEPPNTRLLRRHLTN